MARRRAIASSPVLPELDRNSYIRDSIVFELDGIDKGNNYDWEDLIGAISFINYGAEELDNGFKFNGSTSYIMSSESVESWLYSKNRTMEIIFRCDTELTQTSVLFASSGKVSDTGGSFGYGIFPSSKIMAVVMENRNNTVQTFSYSSVLGGNYFATSNGEAVLNDAKLKTNVPNLIASPNTYIHIGRRSTGNYFKGIIHAIRIHDRALSFDELEYNRQVDIKRFKL